MILADADMTQWAMNNGFAVVILVALAGGCWRIATFLGPKIGTLLSAQMDLVESLKTTTATQTKILERHGEKIDAIHKKVVGDHS